MTDPKGEVPQSALPSWMPDEATIGQLANAFFAALPGTGASVPDVPVGRPDGLSQLATPIPVGPGVGTPDGLTQQSTPPSGVDQPAASVPSGVGDPSGVGGPAGGGRSVDGAGPTGHPSASAGPASPMVPGLQRPTELSTPFSGVAPQPIPAGSALPTGIAPPPVPEAAPSHIPFDAGAVDPLIRGVAPASVPSSPYYFIGESSAYRAFPAGPSPSGTAPSLPGPDYTLSAYVLPLQVAPPTLDPSPPLEGTSPGPAAPQFYFLDRPDHFKDLPEASQAGPVPHIPDAHPPFDVNAVRRDFPILSERVNGKPLVWFDNAATTHKPQAVIDRLAYFYSHENSNIHRAAHTLAARATDAYEGARAKVARFLGAGSANEIVFVRGATEAINLVAKTWGKANLHAGDEILISHLEHHANIVPWQQIAAETGAVLKVIPVDDSGQILLERYTALLSDRTKIVAVTHVSNALGTVTPVKEIVDLGHRAGACVLIDGAQSVPHLRVNVQALDADFYLFSGHKIFGPTGIGALYGKARILESMPPWQGGGNMIADVTFEKTEYQSPPNKFEAGTGNIADAVGLGAALDYVNRIGLENIAAYEHYLLEYATPRMLAVPGLTMIGTAKEKASVLSFVLDGYRTEQVGAALNDEGIAVRSGHHCAQPILRRFGQETTVRPSIAFYNTCAEIDLMVQTLHRLAANGVRRR